MQSFIKEFSIFSVYLGFQARYCICPKIDDILSSIGASSTLMGIMVLPIEVAYDISFINHEDLAECLEMIQIQILDFITIYIFNLMFSKI